jgi:hypothetical protein
MKVKQFKLFVQNIYKAELPMAIQLFLFDTNKKSADKQSFEYCKVRLSKDVSKISHEKTLLLRAETLTKQIDAFASTELLILFSWGTFLQEHYLGQYS